MSAAPPATATPGGGQQPQAAYAERKITVSFQLGTGTFGGSTSDQMTYGGLRVIAQIEVAAMPNTGHGYFQIYGLPLSDMNQLSRAGLLFKGAYNYITVQAGDDLSGMTTVYKGIIIEAYPSFKSQPDTFFYVHASPAVNVQLKPVPAVSFPGAVPVSTPLQKIAQSAGFTLENKGGISTMLQAPYFPGTAWTQALSAIRAADCFGYLDGINNVLAIWPKDGNRGGTPTDISPEMGMVGYPEFMQSQVRVRTIFSPSLFVGVDPGHQIKVKSQLAAANGTFVISAVTHDLASQLPDGPWFTTILGTPVGFGP